ncbi:site-specific integrase [Paenibacillus sp. KQZ6P-2]|uniref:Site-specific integrase n=1 Tax=Paenibacillus mangrovi TaxID=2931978 RepID=A0A9X1WZV4_9BACL|nr:site-specific integrase [Paenibacillus mangrovi]MCJ8015274.1 site-specific integrase [Paenibacillus mangrovi]
MASVKKNKGTKKWEFVFDYYDQNGLRKQVRRRGFNSKREADEAMAQLHLDVQNQEYVGTDHTTLGDFIQYWLDNIRKMECSETTFYNNKLYYKNHIKDSIGNVKLQRLDLNICQRFVTNMHNKGYARNTIDRVCTLLKCAIDKAIEYGLLKINYMRKVTLPKKEKSNLQIWTLDQVNTFLEFTQNRRYHCVYALALLAGMRQGEILGLRWKDIDFTNKIIYINQTLTHYGTKIKQGAKTYAGVRKISIPNQLIDILKEQRKRYETLKSKLGSGWVDMDIVIFNFANGKTVFPGNLTKAYAKDIERCGLPHIRFHDLRHTHATLLLSKGINVKVISERLGHTKVGVTLDTYSHVLPSMQQEVTNTLEEIILV